MEEEKVICPKCTDVITSVFENINENKALRDDAIYKVVCKLKILDIEKRNIERDIKGNDFSISSLDQLEMLLKCTEKESMIYSYILMQLEKNNPYVTNEKNNNK